MSFLTQGKTNWKFLLIVVVLAAIVGGGTIWLKEKQEAQFTKLPEIKIPGSPAIEQKVSVVTNKTEYDYVYDEDFGEFDLEEFHATIKNEGDSPIWYRCMATEDYPEFGLESYENGKWGEGSAVFFSDSVTFLGYLGRSPSEARLNPQETITAHVTNTFIPGYKYRLVFYPQRRVNCLSSGDPNCYLETAYSNEFVIKEKPELVQEMIGAFEFIDENQRSDFSGLYIFRSNDGDGHPFILADGKVAESWEEFLNKKVLIKGYTDYRVGMYTCLEYEEETHNDYNCIQRIEELIFIIDIKIAK